MKWSSAAKVEKMMVGRSYDHNNNSVNYSWWSKNSNTTEREQLHKAKCIDFIYSYRNENKRPTSSLVVHVETSAYLCLCACVMCVHIAHDIANYCDYYYYYDEKELRNWSDGAGSGSMCRIIKVNIFSILFWWRKHVHRAHTNECVSESIFSCNKWRWHHILYVIASKMLSPH